MSTSLEHLPYMLPDEVVLHNKPGDCWSICLGSVYNLTEYLTRNAESPIAKWLLAHGGRDVSHWFDVREGQAILKRYVDPATGQRQILLPYAFPRPEGTKSAFVPVSMGGCCRGSCRCVSSGRWFEYYDKNNFPVDREQELSGKCWSEIECIFNHAEYRIGRLTKRSRPCRITNMLTGQRILISVCEEDSINRIRDRALLFNRHGESYTWKFEGKPLNPALTLTENGILDERDRYVAAGLPDDSTTYVPNLLCYYNDDLTEL